jgi:hypothetical protein
LLEWPGVMQVLLAVPGGPARLEMVEDEA